MRRVMAARRGLSEIVTETLVGFGDAHAWGTRLIDEIATWRASGGAPAFQAAGGDSAIDRMNAMERDLARLTGEAERLRKLNEEVARIAESVGLPARIAPGIEGALALAGEIAFERPPRILICGSLYLAGQVLRENA